MFKIVIFFIISLLFSCSKKVDKDELAITLKANPQIVLDLIEKNPAMFIGSIQKAAKLAQADLAKEQNKRELNDFENSFKNPLKPLIRKDETIFGNKNGDLTIVEYSDFECPFCQRGYTVVQELMKKYDGRIRFIYKHLPLSFHQQSMISAQYYEAIRMQSESKALQFHNEIFDNQSKLRIGKGFLDSIAKKLSVDMIKLEKDINSDIVKNRIDEDMKEAASFGMQGTPGFLVNGIPVKGAYPLEHFISIISRLDKK